MCPGYDFSVVCVRDMSVFFGSVCPGYVGCVSGICGCSVCPGYDASKIWVLSDPDGHVWEETFFRDEKKGCENHSLVISKVIYRFPGKKRTSSETLING